MSDMGHEDIRQALHEVAEEMKARGGGAGWTPSEERPPIFVVDEAHDYSQDAETLAAVKRLTQEGKTA